MKTYKADKNGPVIYLMVGYLLLMVFAFVLDSEGFFERTYLFFPFILPFSIGLWALLDTSYQIEGGKLRYRSGFLRGEIEITTIKEILKGKTRWIGPKPALATNGLIIKYNRFEDVYLAPKNNKEFIADLLKIKHQITVS